jgi:cytochrome c peroxidase
MFSRINATRYARADTDNKFHNLGVGADLNGKLADVGRYAVTKNDADMGAFKTASLRNLANRAPSMHDGTRI